LITHSAFSNPDAYPSVSFVPAACSLHAASFPPQSQGAAKAGLMSSRHRQQGRPVFRLRFPLIDEVFLASVVLIIDGHKL